LTKTVKPKLETSTFWCLQGFSPISLKKEGHCCLRQRRVVRGDTHPELLGKGEEEVEDWRKRVSRLNGHEGLLVTTAVQVDPAQGQYWSTGSKG
jgi:hypothetical protein